ncbi:hypothetical protein [Methylobacterium aquaticum]|uniref:hypothetical protein n=1 Tax=Methylobacterium aquaticum TaxID=270351 RepID=UPI0019337BD7|nr:hypothetical protein [Methylobacterium aquaticum]QRE76989.1 hypothetical protein F1D61_28645 [Methylobacterium aquaticum]
MRGRKIYRAPPRAPDTDWVRVAGTVIRTSDAAVLFELRRDVMNAYAKVEQKWIPRSLVLDGAAVVAGSESLSVRRWFAEKNGLPIIGLAPTNES